MNQNIINIKYQLREKWRDLEKYLKHNINYKLFYKWFLKDFLNQDISVNEEEITALAHESDTISVIGEDNEEYINLDKKAFYSNTFICHIRMDLVNPGEIVAVSKSCYGFTGYSMKELMRSKINKLMPKVIAENHDIILKEYITVGIKYTDNKIDTFLKLKNSAVKPVTLLIKLFYQVYGNIEMVGLFREIKSRVDTPEHIVMDSNGVKTTNQIIQGMTKNLCDEFGLPPTLFSYMEYNIMISLPKLREYFILKSSNKDPAEKDNPDDHPPLEKKSSQSSGNKTKFIENMKDRFALLKQPTGKSDRSGISL